MPPIIVSDDHIAVYVIICVIIPQAVFGELQAGGTYEG
jgi:hypothetical protein